MSKASKENSTASRDDVAAAQAFLGELFQKMGIEAQAAVTEEGRTLRIDVTGDDADALVSGSGATARSEALEALQLVLTRTLYGGSSGNSVVVDANGFREARTALLAGAADRIAKAVTDNQKAYRIMAINGFDRRAVHTRLADSEAVHTESDGYGVLRALVVKPPRKAEPKRDEPTAESAAPESDAESDTSETGESEE